MATPDPRPAWQPDTWLASWPPAWQCDLPPGNMTLDWQLNLRWWYDLDSSWNVSLGWWTLTSSSSLQLSQLSQLSQLATPASPANLSSPVSLDNFASSANPASLPTPKPQYPVIPISWYLNILISQYPDISISWYPDTSIPRYTYAPMWLRPCSLPSCGWPHLLAVHCGLYSTLADPTSEPVPMTTDRVPVVWN